MYVEGRFARQEAPQSDAIDNLQPPIGPLEPRLLLRQYLLNVGLAFRRAAEDDLRLRYFFGQVVGIPQAKLPHDGIQSHLEHIALTVSLVLPSTVPDAMMQNENRAR